MKQANNHLLRISLAFGALLVLSGCIGIAPFPGTPVVDGRIVDSSDSHPISGARLVMTDDQRKVEGTTDAAGGFHLHATTDWYWIFIFTDGKISGGTLRVEAGGYRKYELDISSGSGKVENVVIKLHRVIPGAGGNVVERNKLSDFEGGEIVTLPR